MVKTSKSVDVSRVGISFFEVLLPTPFCWLTQVLLEDVWCRRMTVESWPNKQLQQTHFLKRFSDAIIKTSIKKLSLSLVFCLFISIAIYLALYSSVFTAVSYCHSCSQGVRGDKTGPSQQNCQKTWIRNATKLKILWPPLLPLPKPKLYNPNNNNNFYITIIITSYNQNQSD